MKRNEALSCQVSLTDFSLLLRIEDSKRLTFLFFFSTSLDDSRFLGGTAKNASAAKDRQEERKEGRNDPADRMVLCKEVLKPKPKGGGGWSSEEDEKIIAMVKEHGLKKWSVIADNLPGCDRDQCRQRWHRVLNPDIHKGPWGEDEDKILVDAHKKYGKNGPRSPSFFQGGSTTPSGTGGGAS